MPAMKALWWWSGDCTGDASWREPRATEARRMRPIRSFCCIGATDLELPERQRHLAGGNELGMHCIILLSWDESLLVNVVLARKICM
jgi:hypothetical protein